MYYIDKIKETVARISKALAVEEFTIPRIVFGGDLGHAAWLIEQAEPEIAHMERLLAVCESLGIDDTNIGELETLVNDSAYRATRRELYEQISAAAAEVRDGERETERDNSVELLEASGFVVVDLDDFDGWQRTGRGPCERVVIETKHDRRRSEFWYEFILEVNGTETLRGKSGEFSKLLEAVGISQEVTK